MSPPTKLTVDSNQSQKMKEEEHSPKLKTQPSSPERFIWTEDFDAVHCVSTSATENLKTQPSSPEYFHGDTVSYYADDKHAEFEQIDHKVPTGDSPYVKAKHVLEVEKDLENAVLLFKAAVEKGDRVVNSLKDMADALKRLGRTDEAIKRVKYFRNRCFLQSDESVDNILIDLYKRGGRIDEHIELLQHRLKLVEEGSAFGGKRTKIVRSRGKKSHVTIEQERSRLLGDLAWAYMQQENYHSAEQFYRIALSIEPDKNKQCNLAVCLMKCGKISEAKSLLQDVTDEQETEDNTYTKSYERACKMMTELEAQTGC